MQTIFNFFPLNKKTCFGKPRDRCLAIFGVLNFLLSSVEIQTHARVLESSREFSRVLESSREVSHLSTNKPVLPASLFCLVHKFILSTMFFNHLNDLINGLSYFFFFRTTLWNRTLSHSRSFTKSTKPCVREQTSTSYFNKCEFKSACCQLHYMP